MIVKLTQSSMQARLRFALTWIFAMATASWLNGQAIVPNVGTTPPINFVTINAGPGDQTDPHISGDLVSYSDGMFIRYYNFSTNTDAQIPLTSDDSLSG